MVDFNQPGVPWKRFGRARPCLSRRPVEHSSSQDVDVQVKYRLPSAGAVIDHRAITTRFDPALASEFSGNVKEMSDQTFVFRFHHTEGFEVSPRYHEEMDRRLRVQILDRNRGLILEHDLGRGLPPDDSAEDAVFHG
jgi:hypothetical protein